MIWASRAPTSVGSPSISRFGRFRRSSNAISLSVWATFPSNRWRAQSTPYGNPSILDTEPAAEILHLGGLAIPGEKLPSG